MGGSLRGNSTKCEKSKLHLEMSDDELNKRMNVLLAR